MDKRFYEEEKERILAIVRSITDHFPEYINECNLNWPICYKHKTVMTQVMYKDGNPFYQCLDLENGLPCGHKEYNI
jgi:hypothetical protein